MAKNVIIGQSGGPTAVINSSLAGVYKAACSLGADKVYGMKYGIEGLLKEELVELNVLLDDRLSIELLKRTPSSYLGSCRYKLPEPEADSTPYVKLFTLFDKYDICAVFYIGGNDSMDTIAKLSRYGAQVGSAVRFIGVPKTIDNDLCLTDHTPGYGSAAKYIATILKEVIRDSSVYDIRSVTVAEIMGRHAGWLTAASVLARKHPGDNPLLIYLPEMDFDMETMTMDIPPIAVIDGIELVTEGVITLSKAIDILREYVKPDYNPKLENRLHENNAASMLARLLIEDCDSVKIYQGTAINPAHQDLAFKMDFTYKINQMNELTQLLEKMGKDVEVTYI